MKFDYEIIKDIIIERDPTVRREKIIFENVYMSEEWISFFIWDREFVWSNKFECKLDDYESRLKEKLRDNKLDELGI